MEPYANAVLNEREKTHGSYADVATTAQSLKSVMANTKNWLTMPDHARESLEMIATKIARICSGDYSATDHYEDVSGYAQLSAHIFEREQAR